MRGLSVKGLWTMVEQHDDLAYREALGDPEETSVEPGELTYQLNQWSWNDIDPESLEVIDDYIVYSWPLLCEKYANVTVDTFA
mmetsp:Transcript_46429/g.63237  ORF Transcript_46429/g.63237 Transcript_46429/m.63237 type:complete len:83 (+) Transcript_46429:146-394(+)